MGTVLGIIVSILGLGFLILVHELGHFLVAKATGMRVEEFSVGYGRFIASRRIGETVYGIGLVPLGGYVRVTGMHQEEFEARQEAARLQREAEVRDPESYLVGDSSLSNEEAAETPLHRRYYAKPLWQRLVFLVSGVAMNMVVALVLLVIVGLQGTLVPTTGVEEVVPDSPAAAAGLMPGDIIVSVAGTEADSWEEIQAAIRANPGRQVTIVIDRQGARLTLTATLAEQDSVGFLGVGPKLERRPLTLGESIDFAGEQTWGLMTLLVREIGKMVTGESPVTGSEGGLAGPLGIVAVSSSAFQGGYFLILLAFISIQLAVFNMLPLLPLDGGHFFLNLLQAVTRRRFSLRTFERFSLVGISLFFLLALVATGNDIMRLASGQGF